MPEEVAEVVAVESSATAQQPAESTNQKAVETLVLDTNLFIKGLPVDHISNRFVTVPDVVHELRSRASKDRYSELELKYGIELIEPDGESIRAVRNFAKKTGDFASLALADMKVIALAFMLEKQANGMQNLRLEPIQNNPDITDRKLLQSARIAGSERSKEQQDGKEKLEDIDEEPEADKDEQVEQNEQDIVEQIEQLSLDSSDAVLQPATNDELDVGSEEDEEHEAEDEESEAKDEDDGWQVARPKAKKKAPRHVDEFFNGGWITPSNVKKRQAADAMGMREAQVANNDKPIKVACVTSDFAMQNTMLKMGIRLVTPDGVAVHRLRTWVLRCHACFRLTGDMNRQFCPSCGHPTLRRCSVSTGADGKLQVHLKANYRNNLRGTVFSLPKPRGGKHTVHDVITRESERAYINAMRHKKRIDAKSNAGMSGAYMLDDPDYDPGMLSNPLSHGNGYGVATDARGMPMVARNRRNPNVVRHTGNRKKKNRK
ncbi:20S-pre-rRNA D-site endonuclease nob1 [Coemansia brasiliensis]|uniref:20S-pre-rRNA D-site endonuclease NOB1 n=1 Tax=Coemansia brasiliensis TaxID=2650707 RepID=A0A9W8I204_9FUNG|nr:20S-pre-rRNA D-site endonuclease nob1 [Coemansia brasiliensis]